MSFLFLHIISIVYCFLAYSLIELNLFTGIEGEKSTNLSLKLEKKFGQSPVFVASTLLENGGTLKSASPASLLKEAIHVISCGYEDKTDWGKEVQIYILFLSRTCLFILPCD